MNFFAFFFGLFWGSINRNTATPTLLCEALAMVNPPADSTDVPDSGRRLRPVP